MGYLNKKNKRYVKRWNRINNYIPNCGCRFWLQPVQTTSLLFYANFLSYADILFWEVTIKTFYKI